MAVTILTNIPAVNAARQLDQNGETYARAMERVASGKRVNRPGDDAAGLALSFSLEARIRSIHQAIRNAEDGLSLIQVAGGGTNEIGNILTRMRELSIQAASDTTGDSERKLLQIEITQLEQEMDRIANSTSYLGTQLLNGQGRSYDFHIGPDSNEFNRVSYNASTVDLRPSTLGVDGADLTDKDGAQELFEKVDQAISRLGNPLATVGAMQSRITQAISHLRNYQENLIAAKSRITDADFATEMTEVVRGQVQRQASLSILAQANALPKMVLRLLE